MKSVNWTNLFKKYSGLWVALKEDEKTVVSSGKNAKKVYDEALNKGLKIPIMFKVPLNSVLDVG